jgi:hypothetical protein
MRNAFLWAITQRVVVISVRRLGIKQMVGPIGCPEKSVRNCRYSLRNNPEEHTFHLLRSGSLKSQNGEAVPTMVHYAYVGFPNSVLHLVFQKGNVSETWYTNVLRRREWGRYKTTEVSWLIPPLTSHQSEIKVPLPLSSRRSFYGVQSCSTYLNGSDEQNYWQWTTSVLQLHAHRIRICQRGTARTWKKKKMEITRST